MPSPPPTLATPRRPDLVSHGGRVAMVARRFLNLDLYPWQRQVLDVALERNPDGRPRYKQVVVTVPRQSGKTELLGALLFTRMLERRWCWYTAQTRADAFDTFSTRWAPEWESAGFDITIRRSAEMTGAYSPNGGSMRLFRPDGRGLHGKQSDLTLIDEAWGLDLLTGRELEQAAGPTGQTRPEYQEWIVSTAGDVDSAFLAEKIANARQHADGDDRIALFIWDASGADPDNVDQVLDRHPAKGTPLEEQAFDHIRTEFHKMPDRAEFLRAYGNVWPDMLADAFAPRFGLAADTTLHIPPIGTRGLVFAIDATPSGDHADVVAAWPTPTGPAFALVKSARGTNWITNEIAYLASTWRPAAILVDAMSMAAGPARASRNPRVQFTDVRDLVDAAGWMVDPESTYRYIPDPVLAAAAASMRRRKIGERFAFGRASDGAPVSPLVAASLAARRISIGVSRPVLV